MQHFVSQYAGCASRRVNALVLLAVSAMLFFSLAWQFSQDGYACTSCTLQRIALAMAGMGLLLNMRMGPSPMHYSMTIAASLAGAAVSAWQLLLPLEEGPVRLAGLQFDSWAFLAYGGLVAFSLLMLTLDRKWGDNAYRRPLAVPGAIVIAVFLLAVLSSAAGPVLDCGGVKACLPTPQAMAAMQP